MMAFKVEYSRVRWSARRGKEGLHKHCWMVIEPDRSIVDIGYAKTWRQARKDAEAAIQHLFKLEGKRP